MDLKARCMACFRLAPNAAPTGMSAGNVRDAGIWSTQQAPQQCGAVVAVDVLGARMDWETRCIAWFSLASNARMDSEPWPHMVSKACATSLASSFMACSVQLRTQGSDDTRLRAIIITAHMTWHAV
jgi:hypothetical protein